MLTIKPLSKYVATHAQNIVGQMNNLEGDQDIKEILGEITKKLK
jgi:hypothetical protein